MSIGVVVCRTSFGSDSFANETLSEELPKCQVVYLSDNVDANYMIIDYLEKFVAQFSH